MPGMRYCFGGPEGGGEARGEGLLGRCLALNQQPPGDADRRAWEPVRTLAGLAFRTPGLRKCVGPSQPSGSLDSSRDIISPAAAGP